MKKIQLIISVGILIIGIMSACKKESAPVEGTFIIQNTSVSRDSINLDVDISFGSKKIRYFGLCYSSTVNMPAVNNSDTIGKTNISHDVRKAVTINNLKPNTQYYIRAYVQLKDDAEYYYSEVINCITNTIGEITQIEPVSGCYGTEVTLKGENSFSAKREDLKVYFNDQEAKIVSNSPNEIKVLVPKSPGTGILTVKVRGMVLEGPQFTFVKDPYIVYTIAGSGEVGYTDGQGLTAQFDMPSKIVIDQHDNLYIADYANRAIRKVTPSGYVSTIARAENFYPNSLVISKETGNIYTTDYSRSNFKMITPTGEISSLSTTSEDGTTEIIKLNNPVDIVINSKGELFVTTDPFGSKNRIYKIDVSGINTYVGNGTNNFQPGQGTNANIPKPAYLYMDDNDNMLVSAGMLIAQVDKHANVTTYTTNVPAKQITMDKDGYIYTCNVYDITKIAPDKTVTPFAGNEVHKIRDGGISVASFSGIRSIAIDSKGDFFVADWNCIRKIEKVN